MKELTSSLNYKFISNNEGLNIITHYITYSAFFSAIESFSGTPSLGDMVHPKKRILT